MPSRETMLKIARMKFERPVRTNEEVAEALFRDGILNTPKSTKRVKELIEETGQWLIREHERLAALERGDTEEEQLHLAEQLCNTFGLLDARIVPGGEPTNDGYAPLHTHADAAARYIDEAIGEFEDRNQEAHVLVSGGETILEIVSSLPERQRPKAHFYAAAITERGRKTRPVAHIGPETNTTIAWARSGKCPHRLCYGTAAPFRIEEDRSNTMTPAERHEYICGEIAREIDELCANKSIGDVVRDMTENTNMAIAGVGLLQPTALDYKSGIDQANRISMNYLLHMYGVNLDILAKQGAIGDIDYAMIAEDGKGRPEWRFFITPGEGTKYKGPEFYRRMVARSQNIITAGARKETVLLPAIKAKLFNVLITDVYTAGRLLAGAGSGIGR